MTSPFTGQRAVIHEVEGMLYICPHPISMNGFPNGQRHRCYYEAALVVVDTRGNVCKNKFGRTTSDYPEELFEE